MNLCIVGSRWAEQRMHPPALTTDNTSQRPRAELGQGSLMSDNRSFTTTTSRAPITPPTSPNRSG